MSKVDSEPKQRVNNTDVFIQKQFIIQFYDIRSIYVFIDHIVYAMKS